MSDETNRPKNKKRTLWITIGSILLFLIVSFSALTLFVSGHQGVFPNVYVGEVDLSGKSEAEALALLQQTYQPEKIKGITFTLSCKDNTEEIATDSLGITYQNRDSVAAAMAVGGKSPMIRAAIYVLQLLRPTYIEPVITYNNDLLNRTIDAVAGPYETKPVGYTYEMEPDTVTIHAPVAGVMVDRNAITRQVEAQIRALSFSDIVMDPVTTPAETLNFDEFYAWLTSPAENAYYAKGEDDKITVIREKLQCSVDKSVVKNAVESIEKTGNSTASFPVATTEPEVLSLTLKEQLYKDKLGSYSTYYSGSAARRNNVHLATGRIDGYELMPGEEFSYDQTILPRTAANGYQAAPVYVGNKVESGMGGGICQPSSTLYVAALYANLEILERHNHSMMVGYMPAGLDATISQGVLDLRFKNSTAYPIKISAQASGGMLTFSIWGYNPDNISVEVLRNGGGYHYSATRVVKKNGEEIHREFLGSSRYITPEAAKEAEATESATPEETPAPSDTPANPETPAVADAPSTEVPAVTPAPAASAPVTTPPPATPTSTPVVETPITE